MSVYDGDLGSNTLCATLGLHPIRGTWVVDKRLGSVEVLRGDARDHEK